MDRLCWYATLVYPVSGQLIVKLISTCLWGNYGNEIAVLPLLLCCCAETQQNWSTGPGTISESSPKKKKKKGNLPSNVTSQWGSGCQCSYWIDEKCCKCLWCGVTLNGQPSTLFVQFRQCGSILNLGDFGPLPVHLKLMYLSQYLKDIDTVQGRPQWYTTFTLVVQEHSTRSWVGGDSSLLY